MTSEGRLQVGDRAGMLPPRRRRPRRRRHPAVTRPVHFWQGSADTLVPEIINKTVADKTPGAIWHPVEDGGHFIAVSHAAQILTVAANDLASQAN